MKFVGIALYLVALLVIGVVASRRVKDLRDYFAANKSLGFLAVAFSARATGESAWLLLGLTGMGAALGVKALWVVLGEVLGVAAAWMLMSRRFHRLTTAYDAITIPDYLERRFDDKTQNLRRVAAIALVIFVTIYVSAQIDATGSAFESFLGWNYYTGALVGFAVVMAYTVSGGFVAVVWSDVFQGSLMVLGLAFLPVLALIHIGGFGPLMETLRSIDPDLLSLAGSQGWTATGLASILGLSLIGLGFLGSPQIFVRFLALRDENEINRGTWTAILFTVIADTGAVVIGLCGRAILTGADLGNGGQDVLPLLVDTMLPAFLVGLYIAIVLSATMSTVDSLLVVASSAYVRDYHQQIKNPGMSDESLLKMSRNVTFLLATVALAIAMTVAVTTPGRTIFWFVIFGWSGIAATFCPAMILSLSWDRFNARGAMGAMISGFFAVPLFKFGGTALPGFAGVFFSELGELAPAFLLSMVVGAVLTLQSPKKASAT